MGMRVDGPEVELACQQEDDRSGGAQPAVSAGLPFGCLEQSVQGLQEAVGLAALNPGCNSIEVTADHAGHSLHRLYLRSHHVGAPLGQHPAHDMNLLALQDFPELLTVQPGSRSPQAGQLREQSVQFSSCLAVEVTGIAQQLPAHALQVGVVLLLSPPGQVDGPRGLGDNVELVEGDLGTREMVSNAFDEGLRHVDAARLDSFRLPAMLGEELGQLPDSGRILALGHEDHGPLFGVGGNHQVVMATCPGSLIDGQLANLRKITLGNRKIDIALADRHDSVNRQSGHTGHAPEGHLLGQQQHQGLEQQGEARQLPRPFRLDLADASIRQLDPWHADLQKALVLEEVEVAVALGDCVMDRVIAADIRDPKAAAALEIDVDVQGLAGLVEDDVSHVPRRCNAKGGLKDLSAHCSSSVGWTGSRIPTHFSTEPKNSEAGGREGKRATSVCF